MMIKLRVFKKLVLFALVVGTYLCASFFVLALHFFSIPKSRMILLNLVRLVGKAGVKLLGIKVKIKGEIPSLNDHFLIVSNHLGYLDILIISKYFPSVFVTSQEMRETKFLGELCYLGGCHFVERRSIKNIAHEIKEISNTLKENMNIVLFPEAQSTNGDYVKEFKKALFEVGFKHKEIVLPLCLNYIKIDGVPVTKENRDDVCWYGEMSFFPHILNLFKRKSIEVELTISRPLDSRNYLSRNDLADKTYEIISKEYKRIY